MAWGITMGRQRGTAKYKRSYVRKERRKQDRILQRAIKNQEFDSVEIDPRHRHSARENYL